MTTTDAATDAAADAAADTAADLGAALRAAFRGQPAGVAVLTAAGPVGLTASSVASVALTPPAVSFSMARAGASARGILGSGTVLVHLLDASDVPLARRFATAGADRFGAATRWAPLPTGEPRLLDVATALRCRLLSVTDVGESALVAAEVVEVLGGGRRGPALVHVDRAFRAVAR
jgi:flavin reductase (DIM6/NTAB) family NADH-FMN oxidoreductase RutF